MCQLSLSGCGWAKRSRVACARAVPLIQGAASAGATRRGGDELRRRSVVMAFSPDLCLSLAFCALYAE